MVLKSNASLGIIFVGTILVGGFMLFPFYKKYIITEEKLNKVKITQNDQAIFIDQIKDNILVNKQVQAKLTQNFKTANVSSTRLQKSLIRQEQRVLFAIDFLKKLILFEIFFIGFFMLKIHDIGTLVATYQISIWLLPSVTLLIQIILSALKILPQINNINRVRLDRIQKKLSHSNISVSTTNLIIPPGTRKNFTVKKELFLEQGVIYSLNGCVGVGKSTILKHLTQELKKENFHIWLSTTQPVIFNDTIAHNILLGQKLERQSLIKVLRQNGFPQKLLLRLDTLIDETKISGGEAQVIEMARLLLTLQPLDLIIFDESFSALDSTTFNRIWKQIINKFKDKIIIVVSHNLPKQLSVDKSLQFIDYFSLGEQEDD